MYLLKKYGDLYFHINITIIDNNFKMRVKQRTKNNAYYKLLRQKSTVLCVCVCGNNNELDRIT